MLPLDFILKIMVVTSSGALSPGPLTASTIMIGSKRGFWGGVLVSVGHTIVEFPYVVLIALGIATALIDPLISKIIGLIGGIILVFLGFLMAKDALSLGEKKSDKINEITVNSADSSNDGESSGKILKSPTIVGIMLSGLNPYFIIWWLFVGGSLVIQAFSYAGFLGVVIMYLAHVWMDYAFLSALSYFSKKGYEIIKMRGYQILLTIIGIAMIIFGLDFVIFSIFETRILPI
ncbi:MAG: LysE family transporter [Promethearchaeota archaeon]